MPQPKYYFWNLESIRFIAVMMVFCQHGFYNSIAYLNIEGTFLERILQLICDGGIGVSIFFVLSGFLITYLLVSEYEQQQKISISKFYIRRILRIWPLFFIVICFSFFIYPNLKELFGYSSPKFYNWLYHVTFLSNFDILRIQRDHFGSDALINNITWSVSIEEQFYLFWPLLFLLNKRFWLSAIITMITFSLTFRIINHQDSLILYFHTFSVLIDLAVGALFAYLVIFNKRVRNFFIKSNTPEHAILFVCSFGLLFYIHYFYSPLQTAILRLASALIFGAIISAQALTQNNSILNLEKLRVAAFFGKYTYGIYLLHPIGLLLVDVSLRVMGFTTHNFLTSISVGLLGLAITLVMSMLSHHYFELPFLKLKDKFSIVRMPEKKVS